MIFPAITKVNTVAIEIVADVGCLEGSNFSGFTPGEFFQLIYLIILQPIRSPELQVLSASSRALNAPAFIDSNLVYPRITV